MKLSKTSLILIAIMLLCFTLRYFAAINVEMKPDEMVYTVNAININQANVLSTLQQGTLYSHFTDIWFMLFGPTSLTARLTSIIFAVLSTIILFLIGKDHFNSSRTGLFAAFFFAVSAFAIRYNYEMDMMGFSLALLSIYFFLYYLKETQKTYLYLTSLFFILAVLSRNLVLLLAPAFVIVLAQKWNKHPHQRKEITKHLGTALIIAVIALSPLIIYNMLVYQNTGYTDYYVSDFFGVGKNAFAGFENKAWNTNTLASVFSSRGIEFLKIDFLLIFFSIFGFIIAHRTKKYNAAITLFIAGIIPFLIYLAGVTGSPTHYIFIPLTCSLFAGVGMNWLWEYLATKPKYSLLKPTIIGIIIITTLFMLRTDFTSDSSVLNLREYVHEHIESNALIVADQRIYNGIHAWSFGRKYYMQTDTFVQYSNSLKDYNGPKINIPFYYVECGPQTTCAWRTEDYNRIANQSEVISRAITQNLEKVAEVSGNEQKAGARHHFIIYKGTVQVSSNIYTLIDQNNQFWGYSIAWRAKENNDDYYEPKGVGFLAHYAGMLVLYLELLLILVTIVYLMYIAISKANQHSNKEHSKSTFVEKTTTEEIREENKKEEKEIQ
ncbi:glycosyltransferase family 39 protein [Candidatus Woesearchaeota archaeon]|nr:glycosyltransferase family 39 protein [Candidatus Woesearchaeota archaeon]